MNPPYGGHEDKSIQGFFPDDLASSETADLFMSVILYRLKKNGRAAVVVPDGFLFGLDNAKVNIKKKLIGEFNLHTVVRLPGSVFSPYTSIHDIENDEVVELPRLYNTIGAMFSRPYNGDASKYLSTQYIAEEIKNMGFDGLRFRSSLNKNGYNIVLFNPDDCVAVSSDLVEVKGIDLKLDEPMIYKVGTPKLKEEMTNLDWMK